MAKIKSTYVCSECGYEAVRWMGKCPECLQWNTMNEEIKEVTRTASTSKAGNNIITLIHDISSDEDGRYKTGISELDRVLGGGIVAGSVVLLSGEPGIGKSTLLLQICQPLCKDLKILYVSGEESPRQLKLRAIRLGITTEELYVTSITDIESVIAAIDTSKPNLVIIDSIQTMNMSTLSSSSGSVTQVRECTNMLISKAKNTEIPILIVGHVNKDGAIAGPKVLEHMVDAVLYFEGERHLSYRILRAVKNRYGSTNEIGVFEMSEKGLQEVANPSMAMLSGRPSNTSGTCVACVMEGSRPILAEVQALVCKTAFSAPRRTSTGFDYNRTSMLLAVLEKRAGHYFSTLDTYVNIVGGLRLDEPAADLPVALALISSVTDRVIPENVVAFGEIGLAGEIRSVSHINARVNEAFRLGFTKCIIPLQNVRQLNVLKGCEIKGVENVGEALSAALS